jgi:hypothetical protein
MVHVHNEANNAVIKEIAQFIGDINLILTKNIRWLQERTPATAFLHFVEGVNSMQRQTSDLIKNQ